MTPLKAILFDFGGTLDSDGGHWLDRFYEIYEEIGLGDLPARKVKDAFYHADKVLEDDPAANELTLRPMMERHVAIQFEQLGIREPKRAQQAVELFCGLTHETLQRNAGILKALKDRRYRLGVISNFYGNVAALCNEYGFLDALDLVYDSVLVGIRKPDIAIFQKALGELRLSGEEAAMVGDSFERDVLPAKSLGMQTVWMTGVPPRDCPDPSKTDAQIQTLPELLTFLPGVNA